MSMKKRNKVSAEFSMSSLTDIIFLLLIFFMLTANFVRVQSEELPVSDSKVVLPISVTIEVDKNGRYSLNGNRMTLRSLEKTIPLELRKQENKENSTIAIAAPEKMSMDKIKPLIDMAARLKVKVMIATRPSD